jgi:hypothetical protein
LITFSACFSATISFSKLYSNWAAFVSAAFFPERAAFLACSSSLIALSSSPALFTASSS